MALVASYGGNSSSEEDCSDDETPLPIQGAIPSEARPQTKKEEKVLSSSDKEDPFTDEESEDFLGEDPRESSSSLLTASLPEPIVSSTPGFIDETEDISDIPVGKNYEVPEEKPLPRKDPGKKKVQIKLPTLKSLFKDMDETPSSEPLRDSKASEPRNSITSFLPPPKNTFPTFTKPTGKKAPAVPFVPRSVSKKPSSSAESGVPPSKVRKVDSSDEEEEEQSGFFSFHDKSKEALPAALPLPVVINPEIPLEAEPLVGPSKPQSLPTEASPYPQPLDLMRDEAALERLAGKHALRKKEHINNVIEINGEDNRADPKVWLTKAVTEDELSKPGPRVTIKGVQKSRHQITYLAQLAKANEFKLQQEWANNAHSRKQSAQKYGF